MRLKEAVWSRASQHSYPPLHPHFSGAQWRAEPLSPVSINVSYINEVVKVELIGTFLTLPLVSAGPTRELSLYFHSKITRARKRENKTQKPCGSVPHFHWDCTSRAKEVAELPLHPFATRKHESVPHFCQGHASEMQQEHTHTQPSHYTSTPPPLKRKLNIILSLIIQYPKTSQFKKISHEWEQTPTLRWNRFYLTRIIKHL